MANYVFTSESVTEGHPDKICDAVSDAVLDAALKGDKASRVACETAIKTGFVLLAGEITTRSNIDYASVARRAITEIGYTDSAMGFDAKTCGVLVAVEEQSPDISQGVTEGKGMFKEQGAGDQGLMFGYACDETPELMPAPIMYAHKLTKQLAVVRKKRQVDFLRPDGKSQVTVEYENDRPKRIDTVVISTQHSESVKYAAIKEAVMELVIKKALPANLLDKNTKYFINPTGRFVIGGPFGDAGLTGRKIIVDTYGGMGRHGGGAFSGKDPSKVDRSACYFARFVAKNLVAAGVARRCEVQVAYAIGVAKPMGVYVNTFGTGKVDDQVLADYVSKEFDFRPRALIEELGLLRPIYAPTAAYGHFGRSEFSWEKTTRAKKIASDLLGSKASSSSAPKANAKERSARAKKSNGKAAPKSSPRPRAARQAS
ncbi:MAG: methionine adenosyltransferase [Myxococcales bacterium]|nr:methionine adenosyltransferase [Myxococcales bacterium]